MHRFTVLLLASWTLAAQTDVEWLNRGVQAFKAARYAEAVQAFERAVDANPGNVTAHLYLGTAHMQQYSPGIEAPDNVAHADRAAAEFHRVLELEPANKVAMSSIASLELNRKRFDEARAWYKRLATIDPSNPMAYYSIAFSIWSQWYPEYGRARELAGLAPEAPGPIPDPGVRDSLRARWWTTLDEGIFNLKRALDLDPEFADAMAYLNLFLRQRADLVASKQDYQAEVQEADRWVQRALDAKMKQAATRQPPLAGPNGAATPRVAIGASVQNSKLVNRVNPVYPDLARQAHVEGAVRLMVVIGKDGRVNHIEVNSGHPLLVPAAMEAVRQWQYQPTLLNGQPVEVKTDVEVTFSLGN